MRSESEFLVDVLARLNAAGVEYMLAGSMASNYWGIPRTTHDLDFVLALNPDQVDRLIAAFDPGFFIQPEVGPLRLPAAVPVQRARRTVSAQGRLLDSTRQRL